LAHAIRSGPVTRGEPYIQTTIRAGTAPERIVIGPWDKASLTGRAETFQRLTIPNQSITDDAAGA
jgi:hypothetical protein